MLGSEGGTEDQILPIGVMIAAEPCDQVSCRCAGREGLPIELPQLGRCHHRDFRGNVLQAGRAIVADLRLASHTFLRGDEDDTVRGAGAVYCCGRSILQDCK